MPRGCGGQALAAKLLKIDPQMRVLHVSGRTDAMIAAQGTIEPGGMCRGKPLSPSSLASTVRDAVDAASPSHLRIALA